MKVYILIKSWDYADNGFIIIGVFKTLEGLRAFVTKNHAEFTLDEDGDYYCENKEGRFSEEIYLTIYEEELIENTDEARR